MKLAALTGLAIVLLAAALAPASAAPDWNGTWIGNWKDGNGTQIVFTGSTFISIYWDGDYIGDATGEVSADGKTAKIAWKGGSAVITRDGAAAHIVITEKGKPSKAFPLRRDS